MASHFVGLKLSDIEYELLTQLADLRGYPSLSAVLRDGLLRLIEQENLKPGVMDQLRLERRTRKPRRVRGLD